ncbi:MAG: hypothetical protein ABEJ70_04870 [Halobacteriaceae archaeon]
MLPGETPTLVALETLPVLRGARPGASVQFTDRYLSNRVRVLEAGPEPSPERLAALRETVAGFDVPLHVDRLDRPSLREGADRLRAAYRELPAVDLLREEFPGRCLALPEFLRAGGQIQYGLRLYFFRSGAGPDAGEVLDRNVDAVLADDQRAFERYQGELFGYPDCCVTAFEERAPGQPSPERRSVDPLADALDADRLGDADASVDEVVPDLFENPYAPAFYARKFYPEPRCDAARDRGEAVLEALTDAYGARLARDYVRLNYALAYWAARAIEREGGDLPSVGALGAEQAHLYRPLAETLALPRYADD